MLVELTVENYAVVEQAHIRFHDGLNLLTGETGSGKSIVVDSFSLLLGARASAEMIRSGEAKARISGLFSIDKSDTLNQLFDDSGIDYEGAEDLIVVREIAANGKSRAFVADRPVTTAFLRQLAPFLGDIHGQNDQQLLFAPQMQREMLDRYLKAEELRYKVRGAFQEYRKLCERLEDLSRNEQETLRLLDLWTFQRKEIESVQPKSGEDAELEAERRILQNVSRLEENASTAFTLLYESPSSAMTQVRQAQKRVDELVRIDPTLSDTVAVLKQASVSLEEASYALRDYLGHLEGDPARLEDVESRLAALDRLKRKYGGTTDEVLAFLLEITIRIDEVENASEHRLALEKQKALAAQAYEEAAAQLSARRQQAASRLSTQIEHELQSLAMSGTLFQIAIERGVWGEHGFDQIAFLVSPNRGEELKPLEKIASGGELSRIALALKTAAGEGGEREALHTLVFDEVDAGVGGAAAASVGRRLKALARRNQVICVTHLA